ncbi:lipase maturation factor family protein [Pseudactinotalea sp. HY158]|uniref:lipase maturation factor family protein n=1 Tax=Pseudactinotalea sp. HY158 TaxID=2654547 RepID=UPI00129CC631|nr:lipase maturation factor family protein [Pseudactinotalea sp. HY158]QGH70215.1 lipase maturation factor family protein [Pseudactinotalea sp. HY158]
MDAQWLAGGLLTADADLARAVLQRGIAAIYAVAFLAADRQFPALLGEHGLLPARDFLRAAGRRRAPSLFHGRYSDRLLRVVARSGLVLALAVVVGVPQLGPWWAPALVFGALYGLYLSIVNAGQVFYGFGWESLLLEAGFLAVFLGSGDVGTPVITLVAFRWLLFRVEFGAGMIKLRGDRVWRDLTALDFHHETQPMPGPLSWFFHHLPRPLHRVEVAANHVVQLGVPWLLFAPQPIATWAAAAVIATQLWLVASGNFAWLNWLTMLLAFAAVGDSVLGGAAAPLPPPGAAAVTLALVSVALGVLVLVLSPRPVANLLSRRQRMNAAFNRWHLVGAYGAFGSITRRRREVVIEATADPDPAAATWHEYGFRGKPGDPHRLPRQFAPYHLRLDWGMWFLALGSRAQLRWFERLLRRLLQADPATLRLLAHDPMDGARPAWVRARVFDYRYSTWAELRSRRQWWVRREAYVLVDPIRL